MADKRYQVFISSTLNDLKRERHAVADALMGIGCIPAGMEHFPAIDEEQLQYIKRIIDQSDYYLVIVGGRYGSITPDGMSYTEKEYEYAKEKGKKVVALLHGRPDTLAFKNSEATPAVRKKLAAFRTKLQDGKLTRYWKTSGELTTAAMAGIMNAISVFGAIGWVRADQVANVDALTELNELRKRNEELVHELLKHRNASLVSDLADLDELFEITGLVGASRETWRRSLTWAEIFREVALAMGLQDYEDSVRDAISSRICSTRLARVDDESLLVIKATLMAHGFIVVVHASGHDWWQMTQVGSSALVNLNAARTRKQSPQIDSTPKTFRS